MGAAGESRASSAPKRWPRLLLSVALLVQAAHAAEVQLEIAPPEPKWVLPPLICRNSSITFLVCIDAQVGTRDFAAYSVPQQVQPEGIPTPEEEQILIDVSPDKELFSGDTDPTQRLHIGTRISQNMSVLYSAALDGTEKRWVVELNPQRGR